MRTTLTLDDDVYAAVNRLRRETDRGVSEIVNDLIRSSLHERGGRRDEFVQATDDLGIRVDVTNIGEALDLLDGPEHR